MNFDNESKSRIFFSEWGRRIRGGREKEGKDGDIKRMTKDDLYYQVCQSITKGFRVTDPNSRVVANVDGWMYKQINRLKT